MVIFVVETYVNTGHFNTLEILTSFMVFWWSLLKPWLGSEVLWSIFSTGFLIKILQPCFQYTGINLLFFMKMVYDGDHMTRLPVRGVTLAGREQSVGLVNSQYAWAGHDSDPNDHLYYLFKIYHFKKICFSLTSVKNVCDNHHIFGFSFLNNRGFPSTHCLFFPPQSQSLPTVMTGHVLH